MNETRNILIGFEIGKKTSQLCYYDRRAKEAVSVPTKVGTNLYEFPTALLLEDGTGAWHFGLEAEYFERKGAGVPVRNILDKVRGGIRVTIKKETYEAVDLLAVFFREALKLLGVPDPVRAAGGIAVTGSEMDGTLARAVRKALLKLGFAGEQCLIMGYDESFYYYSYSQTVDKWARGTALIRFEEQSARLFRINEFRARKPYVVTLGLTGETELPVTGRERDDRFSQFLKNALKGANLSAIYITGTGFGAEWAKKSIEVLGSAASHVYEGNNLFVKGACWALVEKRERHVLKDRFFDSPDVVHATVGIDVSDRGVTGILPLVRAGENWYNEDSTCQLILNGRKDLLFTVLPMERERHRNVRMELPDLPERPARASRIALSVSMSDAVHVTVRAEDLGFGELYPSGGRKWEQEFDLGDAAAQVL